MKKVFFAVTMITAVLALTGCFRAEEPIMNEPAKDGNYHYRNQDLGFSLTLPPAFEYYQTQRKESGAFVDIEFFVPTGDTGYAFEVPGYAKPVVVRIFGRRSWESSGENGSDGINRTNFLQAGESGDKIYTIKFWDDIPGDWREKWSEEAANKIKDNFSVIK